MVEAFTRFGSSVLMMTDTGFVTTTSNQGFTHTNKKAHVTLAFQDAMKGLSWSA